jgi:antitoxin component of RelBE/YafQ-DinJ toxin-antitoxin module
MATATSQVLIKIDTDLKLEAQELLEDKYGINLVTFFRMQLKKLVKSGRLDIEPAVMWRQITAEEDKIINTFEAKKASGKLELISHEDLKSELDWIK